MTRHPVLAALLANIWWLLPGCPSPREQEAFEQFAQAEKAYLSRLTSPAASQPSARPSDLTDASTLPVCLCLLPIGANNLRVYLCSVRNPYI